MSEFLFLHEFGHGFLSLADEYYTSDVPYTDFFELTVEPYQENITTLIDFGRKWQDMVDPDTPVPTPDDPIYYHTVEVFEGGGYQAKGIYRPYYDCTMKSKNINNFCPVCKRAIRRTIEGSTYYYNQEVFYLALKNISKQQMRSTRKSWTSNHLAKISLPS